MKIIIELDNIQELSSIKNLLHSIPIGVPMSIPKNEDTDSITLSLNSHINVLGLSALTKKCLLNENITTIAKLRTYSAIKLLKLPNFGYKALKEVRDSLNYFNLTLLED